MVKIVRKKLETPFLFFRIKSAPAAARQLSTKRLSSGPSVMKIGL